MKRLLTTLVILTGLIGSGGAVWADAVIWSKGKINQCIDKEVQWVGQKTKPKESISITCLQNLAELGDPYAQSIIGNFYRSEYAHDLSYSEKRNEYLSNSAEKGDFWAQVALWVCYKHGCFSEVDDSKSEYWLKKASENQNRPPFSPDYLYGLTKKRLPNQTVYRVMPNWNIKTLRELLENIKSLRDYLKESRRHYNFLNRWTFPQSSFDLRIEFSDSLAVTIKSEGFKREESEGILILAKFGNAAAKRKVEEHRLAEVRRQEKWLKEAEAKFAAGSTQSEEKERRQGVAENTKRITKAQQIALVRLGLYDGATDGIAGPKTNQSLQRWQSSRGYTGELSEQQTAELIDTAEQYAAKRKKEEQRQAAEARRLEEQRIAAAKRKEEERQAAEARRLEEQRIAVAKRKEEERQAAKAQPQQEAPPTSFGTGSTGSGFFVSKLGHVVTNEHVVRNCGSVTVGDNANEQVSATVLETDKRNDLALLKLSSMAMASANTKSLIQKLGLLIVPLSSNGLLRSDDVELGERLMVGGYPYGDIFSNTIKVTGGMVSAIRGMGDDSGQFQMDAAVQPGNSGGPIYDENGNIVGVVVAQLNKMKVAKAIGSLPENQNFGIKASTVRQFLVSSGLPTKWSDRSERMSSRDIAKIAKNQTVMVVCGPG